MRPRRLDPHAPDDPAEGDQVPVSLRAGRVQGEDVDVSVALAALRRTQPLGDDPDVDPAAGLEGPAGPGWPVPDVQTTRGRQTVAARSFRTLVAEDPFKRPMKEVVVCEHVHMPMDFEILTAARSPRIQQDIQAMVLEARPGPTAGTSGRDLQGQAKLVVVIDARVGRSGAERDGSGQDQACNCTIGERQSHDRS